jgi:hypothetical protein
VVYARRNQASPNGLNKRGYNGTGKIAALRFAERIHVSTVRNGLRQTAYLDLAEVRDAAAAKRDPELVTVEHNVPTAARNGTVVTLSKPLKEQFPNGFDAEFIRGINGKLSKERLMWMFMGHIKVNQVEVEKLEVPRDDTRPVVSRCGNFSVEMFYLEKGYEHELQDVHVFINGVIVGVEKWGKDGHRLANRVYVKAETTAEWSQTHFEHQRERFTSESRNLRMKTIVPAAQEYKNFVVQAVSDYMKELDQKDAERRKEYMDKQMRELEERMSKILSTLFSNARRARRLGTGELRGSYQKQQLVERAQRKPPLSKFSCRLEQFSNEEERYRCDVETMEISVNTQYAHLKAMCATGTRTYASEQAILETVVAAFADTETGIRMKEKYAEVAPRSVSEFIDEQRALRQGLEREAYNLVKTQFEAFRKLSGSLGTTSEASDIEITVGE